MNFEPQYENKFSGYDNSPHGLLTNSAVALSMTIARAVREGPISRTQAPKKDFANQVIYLFQRANLENEISSSPTSKFAEFFSLAYYVASGEIGTFLETPVKTAIRELKESDGNMLHPNFLNSTVPDDILNDAEDLWPGLLESRRCTIDTSETEQRFLDQLGRIQISDAKWVIENLPIMSNNELMIIHHIIEAGLRRIGNRTDLEESDLAEYEKYRTSTDAKTADPMS